MINVKKTFIYILNEFTDIDKDFINDFFSEFELDDLDTETPDFKFSDEKVAKWLGIKV